MTAPLDQSAREKREFPRPILSIVPPSFGQTAVKCGAGSRRAGVNPPAARCAGDIGLSRGAPMHSTLKPKQTDAPHNIVVVAPAAVAVAPADQQLSSRLHDAARRLSQAQARAGSDVPAGAVVPPVDTT